MTQKPSIFAQRMKLQREGKLREEAINSNDPSNILGDRSFIVTGNEAQDIHHENITKLSQMTVEEINEERNRLLAEMNPSLLKFIQGKRKKTGETSVAESRSIEPSRSLEHMDTGDVAKEETNISGIVANEAKELAKYPHMDVVEKDKLQWIEELPSEIQPPSDPYPARFNFDGELLPYSDHGEGVLQGLYNHGEEPERPGYSLQELIQLSRSSVLQQRVISLNTLAKIMAKASIYDKCFNEPILPALLEADMFLLLRFSLDDPAPPVVMASASALSNLLVNQVDEACLDTLLGSPGGLHQPSLGVILDMKQSDIDELTDQQLLKLDIIRGALRTDILQRIKYILTELKPEPTEIKQLLKALIRISRHSYEMANHVFTFPGLLKAVRSLLDINDGSSYYPEALKLFRIIASRSHTFAEAIYEKFEIHKPIFAFIAGERANRHPEAMHLALESFYTWQSFLSYNIATDTIGSLNPVLMRLIETHLGLTNIDGPKQDLEHATTLISTIAVVGRLNFGQVNHILTPLLQATSKWVIQYLNSSENNFAASKLLGSCFSLFAAIHHYFDSGSLLLPHVEKIILSHCFRKIITRLRKSSWCIHGKIISSPENLPCLGCIPPIIKEESTLPFVYSMAVYILATKNEKLMESFLADNEVLSYVKTILKDDNLTRLCGHWYAKQELNFLVIVIHLFTLADIRENQDIYHKLACRLLTSVQMGDKTLLQFIVSNTIFNPKYFSLGVDSVSQKLNELKISANDNSASKTNINRHSLLHESIKVLPDIQKLYSRELGLEGLVVTWPPVTLTGLLNSTQSALPLDWPFLPLLRLYERQRADKVALSIVTLTLQWFIITEELLPDIFTLDFTAKYCRLCCVYLASSDLFQDVSSLLEVCLYYINRHKEELNFEKPIPGLTSFYDFYRELLEHYAGVSYGNVVFGQYILVPLQQRHSNKYKKIIWNELAAVLRLLSTPIDQVEMKDYLLPLETDSDLLRTYLRMVGTGKVRDIWCPILYQVAVHHVSTYVKTHSDKIAKSLLSLIKAMGNQELRNHLLNYVSEY